MKILNLYAGIGGNRKLWSDEHKITAVEFDEATADVYSSYFPNDNIIVDDAHKFLLDHYKEYDFIWSSPPCPTHSSANYAANGGKNRVIKYPSMTLYQEIILLDKYFKGKWVVENVVPYYTPLIPAKKSDRHLWWSNFNIGKFNRPKAPKDFEHMRISDLEKYLGYDLSQFQLANKLKNLRNCVHPETGKYILECALGVIRKENINQIDMFEDVS